MNYEDLTATTEFLQLMLENQTISGPEMREFVGALDMYAWWKDEERKRFERQERFERAGENLRQIQKELS